MGANLFEDPLYSSTAYSPGTSSGDASILSAPPIADAGVGLTPSVAPVPVAPAPTQERSMGDRIAYAMEAFGAGMKGQPSLLERERKQEREDKLLKVKELKEHVDALESGSKIAKTLQGNAKKSFVKDYATQLDQMRPGLGGTFAHIAENPDTLDLVQQYMPYLPEATKLLMKQNPDAFWKYTASEGGQKDIENAKNQYYVSLAAKKATLIMGKLDLLGLPDEVLKTAKSNPGASTFKQIQDALPDGSPAKLTDQQWNAINSSTHTQDTFYHALGMTSPKDEAQIKVKIAERKAEGPQSTVGKIKSDLEAGTITQAEADAAIKQATTHPAPVNVYSGSLTAGVDAEGNPIFVQPSGREGVQPRTVEGVRPPPKQVDPIKKAIGEAINPSTKGKEPVKEEPSLSPAIVTKLKPNVNTTLSDGSVWTLKGGKPVQLKPPAAIRFSNDPAMKGNSLGPRSELGHEVMDANGNLIGHYA